MSSHLNTSLPRDDESEENPWMLDDVPDPDMEDYLRDPFTSPFPSRKDTVMSVLAPNRMRLTSTRMDDDDGWYGSRQRPPRIDELSERNVPIVLLEPPGGISRSNTPSPICMSNLNIPFTSNTPSPISGSSLNLPYTSRANTPSIISGANTNLSLPYKKSPSHNSMSSIILQYLSPTRTSHADQLNLNQPITESLPTPDINLPVPQAGKIPKSTYKMTASQSLESIPKLTYRMLVPKIVTEIASPQLTRPQSPSVSEPSLLRNPQGKETPFLNVPQLNEPSLLHVPYSQISEQSGFSLERGLELGVPLVRLRTLPTHPNFQSPAFRSVPRWLGNYGVHASHMAVVVLVMTAVMSIVNIALNIF